MIKIANEIANWARERVEKMEMEVTEERERFNSSLDTQAWLNEPIDYTDGKSPYRVGVLYTKKQDSYLQARISREMSYAENELYQAIMERGGDVELITPHLIKRIVPLVEKFPGLRERVYAVRELIHTKKGENGDRLVIYTHGTPKNKGEVEF